MSCIQLTVFLNILQCIIQTSTAQMVPPSPCPDTFQYENDSGRWVGRVEARTLVPADDQVTLSISMTLSARLPSKYVGSIEPVGNRNLILDQIRMGWPVVYRVNFPLITPLPYVVKIVFNEETICTGTGSSGRFVTAIHLEHTLKVETNSMAAIVDDGAIVFDGPVQDRGPKDTNPMSLSHRLPSDDYSESIVDFKPVPPASSTARLFNPPAQCGTKSSNAANPLIANGQIATKGDWPWLVAMFNKKSRGLEFICAGSLITEKLAVTAAHCVVHKSPADVILKLGVYNLQDWTDDKAVTRAIADIRIHPNAEHGLALKSDIAVLIMLQSVSFSDVIQPVCVWERDDNQAYIIGRFGSVIGWGRDETGVRTTPEPRIASVPIVSTEVCRASRKEFLQITTARTFCAGGRDGAGPCNGDSGGGLYLREEDKWILRGIISNSLKDPVTNGCNLFEYIVYTDAAKYTTWIKSLIV